MRRIWNGPHPALARLAGLAGLAVLATTGALGCGPSDDGDRAAKASKDRVTATPAKAATKTPTAKPTTEPSTSPAGEPPDPCAVVSKREAEQLAGTPLKDAVPVQESCTYSGPVTGPTAQVEVFVGDGAKKFLDIERQLGHELRPLSGVGDEAYAGDEAVFVNNAGRWVAVHLVRLNDPAENRKPLEDLARKVATRI